MAIIKGVRMVALFNVPTYRSTRQMIVRVMRWRLDDGRVLFACLVQNTQPADAPSFDTLPAALTEAHAMVLRALGISPTGAQGSLAPRAGVLIAAPQHKSP